MNAVFVKVSAANARLPFTRCGPDCIRENNCHGDCCDAKTHPDGCLVTVLPDEAATIEAAGAVVKDGYIMPTPGTRGCPFKENGLCVLHADGRKPFGCRASPFNLTAQRTLIVRNRYKLLPCYRGPGPKSPAYQAFRPSLVLLFGEDTTTAICRHLDNGGGDYLAPMDSDIYAKLEGGNRLRHEPAELLL